MPEPVPEEVLRAWGFEGAYVSEFERGLVNKHWLAERGGERLVFRRYNPARTREAIAWEQELVQHAAAAGWPAPASVPATNGATLVEHSGRLWSAADFLPGEPDLEPTLAGWFERGRLLARLHADLATFARRDQRIGFGITPELDTWLRSSRSGPTFEAALAHLAIQQPGLASLAKDRRAASLEELDRLSYYALPRTPIHGDFQRFNLLWEGEALTGVLDFDFCTLDAAVVDIAITLVPFLPLPAPAVKAVLAGYQSVRELTSAERGLLPALARAQLLWWVARLLSGWNDDPGSRETLTSSLMRTLTVRLPALDAAEPGWRALLL